MTLIAPDKLLHFAISYLLATIDPALAFIAGIGKEIADFFGAGTPDLFDLIADWAGILFAI